MNEIGSFTVDNPILNKCIVIIHDGMGYAMIRLGPECCKEKLM